MKIKFFNENNIVTVSRIKDNFIDGIICSPPYNLGSNPNHRRADQVDYHLYTDNVDNLSTDEYLDIRIAEFKAFERILKQEALS